MRYQAPAYGSFAENTGLLGRRVTISHMEYQYYPQQIYGLHAFLHGLWSRSSSLSDIRHDSPCVVACIEANNEKARQDALDLLDEERDLAAARSAIYQQDLRRYHSRQVKTRTFQEGDLVLRLI